MSRDLTRLLRPRSIAVFGAGWAVKVIEECRRFGFDGDIWPVHPTKPEVAGLPAFASVAELPGAPDAAFVGVNRQATIDIVAALRLRGGGGAVLFASGFAETGEGALQSALLEAAGDMPVLGPNCYGIVNALDGAVIWPDQQGCARVDRGVAILSQSSNIAITLTMQRRGLPLAYVACVGNAAQTSGSALADAMLDDPRVTALGLYVEGIGDAAAFASMVAKARGLGKGVVVLKAGRSEKGRYAAASHTAALAGEAELSSAFLRQCGAGEVTTLPSLIETLKTLHAHGPLTSPSFISISCSGGEAGLMADAIDATSLDFPAIPKARARDLRDLLGPLVTISNPLDYHTFIWGDTERMTDVFTAAVAGFDAGLFVLDPPRADRCSTASYDCVFDAMERTRADTGKPLFVVATLPDSIDEGVAARLADIGVVPLLDVPSALLALEAASVAPPVSGWLPTAVNFYENSVLLDEAEAKALLAISGIPTPKGVSAATFAELDWHDLRPPFALKGLGFAHKSEAGAVRLNVSNPGAESEMPGAAGYLLEEMVTGAKAEILIGLRHDPIYGLTITLGAGGILAELLGDTVHMIAPVASDEVLAHFRNLKVHSIVNGIRGGPKLDASKVVDIVLALQALMIDDPSVAEIEINPLIMTETGAVAVDALIRRAP